MAAIRCIKSYRGRMTAVELCGGNTKPVHKGSTLTSNREIENLLGTSRKQSYQCESSGTQK